MESVEILLVSDLSSCDSSDTLSETQHDLGDVRLYSNPFQNLPPDLPSTNLPTNPPTNDNNDTHPHLTDIDIDISNTLQEWTILERNNFHKWMEANRDAGTSIHDLFKMLSLDLFSEQEREIAIDFTPQLYAHMVLWNLDIFQSPLFTKRNKRKRSDIEEEDEIEIEYVYDSEGEAGAHLSELEGVEEENRLFREWLINNRLHGTPLKKVMEMLRLKHMYAHEAAADNTSNYEEEVWDTMIDLGIEVLRDAEPPARQKLKNVNTLYDVVNLIDHAQNIMVLAGAGISVSCGIPDFRSENGIYSRLQEFNLPDPHCMFDIGYFKTNPRPFFAFAKELFPKSDGYSFIPSRSHCFFKLLEEKNKLLRIYSQNIDMLEYAAGVSEDICVLCHGSFAAATCLECGHKVPGSRIRPDIAEQRVPRCTKCLSKTSVVKPDIVFFGEELPTRYHDMIGMDAKNADLVLIMGTSLNVNPVRSIVHKIPQGVPIVLINREIAGRPHEFDVNLLGNCDTIVESLSKLLGWRIPNPPRELFAEGVQSGINSVHLSARKMNLKYETRQSCCLFEGAINPFDTPASSHTSPPRNFKASS